VVRDPQDRARAILQVWQTAQNLGWQYCGLTYSPIKGPAGNIEYLLWLRLDSSSQQDLNLEKIETIVNESENSLS
jgi:23S rRNA (cytidine1920-2'-O)/16S rRNA (cytidine1409-2'-O)-methyltransferase